MWFCCSDAFPQESTHNMQRIHRVQWIKNKNTPASYKAPETLSRTKDRGTAVPLEPIKWFRFPIRMGERSKKTPRCFVLESTSSSQWMESHVFTLAVIFCTCKDPLQWKCCFWWHVMEDMSCISGISNYFFVQIALDQEQVNNGCLTGSGLWCSHCHGWTKVFLLRFNSKSSTADGKIH